MLFIRVLGHLIAVLFLFVFLIFFLLLIHVVSVLFVPQFETIRSKLSTFSAHVSENIVSESRDISATQVPSGRSLHVGGRRCIPTVEPGILTYSRARHSQCGDVPIRENKMTAMVTGNILFRLVD